MHGLRPRCETCPVRCDGICAALEGGSRLELLRLSRKKSVPAHQAIFRDGDLADYYYNITSGIVKLVKTLADGRQHIVGLLYPTDFMGQSLNRRHTYAAESATEVELCMYSRAPFEAFLTSHPSLEREIFHMTIRELDLCRDWMLLLGRKCSYERVAGFLLMMARRAPRKAPCKIGGSPVHFELPFTRAEMADYLGLTLETVSRQFSQLKKDRIIDLPSSRDIIVPDLVLLSSAAQVESCSEDFDDGQSRAVA